jgi:hypothetical protein
MSDSPSENPLSPREPPTRPASGELLELAAEETSSDTVPAVAETPASDPGNDPGNDRNDRWVAELLVALKEGSQERTGASSIGPPLSHSAPVFNPVLGSAAALPFGEQKFPAFGLGGVWVQPQRQAAGSPGWGFAGLPIDPSAVEQPTVSPPAAAPRQVTSRGTLQGVAKKKPRPRRPPEEANRVVECEGVMVPIRCTVACPRHRQMHVECPANCSARRLGVHIRRRLAAAGHAVAPNPTQGQVSALSPS